MPFTGLQTKVSVTLIPRGEAALSSSRSPNETLNKFLRLEEVTDLWGSKELTAQHYAKWTYVSVTTDERSRGCDWTSSSLFLSIYAVTIKLSSVEARHNSNFGLCSSYAVTLTFLVKWVSPMTEQFVVTHTIRQNEIPASLNSWVTNTPSVKMLCPQENRFPL
jgi:hypothetical protein